MINREINKCCNNIYPPSYITRYTCTIEIPPKSLRVDPVDCCLLTTPPFRFHLLGEAPPKRRHLSSAEEKHTLPGSIFATVAQCGRRSVQSSKSECKWKRNSLASFPSLRAEFPLLRRTYHNVFAWRAVEPYFERSGTWYLWDWCANELHTWSCFCFLRFGVPTYLF